MDNADQRDWRPRWVQRGGCRAARLAGPAGERAAMFLDEMRIELASAGIRNDAIDQVMATTRSYMDVLTTGSSSVTKGWPVSDPQTIDLIHGWLVKHLLDPKRN
jgi:hypothetical protein